MSSSCHISCHILVVGQLLHLIVHLPYPLLQGLHCKKGFVTYGDLMRVYCVNKSASRIGRKSGNVIWLGACVTYGDLMRVYCVNKSASRIGRKSGNVIWLAQQSVFA
jgi:hypothetical protein